jgi:hypothetical protein
MIYIAVEIINNITTYRDIHNIVLLILGIKAGICIFKGFLSFITFHDFGINEKIKKLLQFFFEI